MAEHPAPPGHDEIVLTSTPGQTLCNSLEHRRLGHLAVAVVTFGELGTRWQRDALWQGNWGKSFPLCAQCWNGIRAAARQHRPHLVIRDHRQPAPPAASTAAMPPGPRPEGERLTGGGQATPPAGPVRI
jgi:hypothetical protein